MTKEDLKDKLEPHYDNLDHIVDDIIRYKVSVNQFKLFDTTRFKLKSIWYILRRIEDLDDKYKNLLSTYIAKGMLSELSLTKNDNWGEDYNLYFPFFEAIEFENLLYQGKACLDCFSKALSSVINTDSMSRNLKTLKNNLQSKSGDPKIKRMLEIIEHGNRLHGVVIDPIGEEKKSLRDLITHYEKVDIFFAIRKNVPDDKYILSEGALVNMKHGRLPKFPNYRVTDIANKIRFLVRGIVENCFKIQFE